MVGDAGSIYARMKKILLSGITGLLVSFYLQAVSLEPVHSSLSETIDLIPKPAQMEVGDGFYLPTKVEFIKYLPDDKIRMNKHIPLLRQKDIHSFQLSDEIEATMTVDTIRKEIKVILDAEKYPADIRYTTDGSTPDLSSRQYNDPIIVKDSARIVAGIFRDGVLQGASTEKKVDYHLGINKPVHYNSRVSPKYPAGGMNALLDGFRGGLTYLDGLWQGYTNDLDCVIDMEKTTDIHQVSARFMQIIFPQVFQPGQVEMLTSDDGINFTSQGVIPTDIPNNDKNLSFQEYTFSGKWKARYIRLIAKEVNKGSFLFTDEIVVW
jgi:hexosaminidase